MNFVSNAYEVEIWEGGNKTHSLKINDATSTFRAIKLDNLEEEVIALFDQIKDLNKNLKEIQDRKKDTKISELTSEEQDALIELEKLNKKLRRLNAKFIELLVVDWEKNESIIDSVRGDELRYFCAAIRRAAFGITDNRISEKKKKKSVSSDISKSMKNSKRGDTKKKK
ncbi:hypothetical protein [Leptospira levettii]|uniref:hypothetical protein n=1 Tax=Leptospira levettii TaxID=2023178 RepID=UPI000F63AA4E|nr:hypothetical protein [Leptospira levettii]